MKANQYKYENLKNNKMKIIYFTCLLTWSSKLYPDHIIEKSLLFHKYFKCI